MIRETCDGDCVLCGEYNHMTPEQVEECRKEREKQDAMFDLIHDLYET